MKCDGDMLMTWMEVRKAMRRTVGLSDDGVDGGGSDVCELGDGDGAIEWMEMGDGADV